MTVTLDLDEEIVERARELAKRRGISLEELLGEYVRDATGQISRMQPGSGKEIAEELRRMWATSWGDSRGETWTRDELHERGIR